MPNRISPLVLVLYAGEPSLASTIASVESQHYVAPRFILIGNHPKHQAHERLYRTLNSYRHDHDFSIVLGADMEIVHPKLLSALGSVFEAFTEIDHILFGVSDWYSGENQLGVQAWRRGVRHSSPKSRLFTDIVSSTSTSKFKIAEPKVPLVLHGVDPSELQAIRYGAQRGLKAAASGKRSRWDRLSALANFAARNPAPQRRLCTASTLLSLQDESLGMRCIASTDATSPEDLVRIRTQAQSTTLFAELQALIDDESLRTRLAEERSDGTAQVVPRKLLSRFSPPFRRGVEIDQSAAEQHFYSQLEASNTKF